MLGGFDWENYLCREGMVSTYIFADNHFNSNPEHIHKIKH